jgi:hypothetical protein
MSASSNQGVPISGARASTGPRIAAFGLDAGDRERVARAFRSVKLPVEMVAADAAAPDAVFDAAILPADGATAARIAAARAANRRILIYLVGPLPEVARLAHFGVNAALESLSDSAIAKAVDHTYLLLAGKLRRYARVPVYVPVNILVDGLSYTAITEDLSAGGIAAMTTSPANVTVGKAVGLRLVLPSTEPLALQGVICWMSSERIGVQFERSPEQERLRKWVDEFLG